jgi:hypothetical protein
LEGQENSDLFGLISEHREHRRYPQDRRPFSLALNCLALYLKSR